MVSELSEYMATVLMSGLYSFSELRLSSLYQSMDGDRLLQENTGATL